MPRRSADGSCAACYRDSPNPEATLSHARRLKLEYGGSVLRDLRHAFRLLIQNPGFAAIAILSLALGIGANTAIFTLIDTVLLRSLPVRAPEQLVVLARNPDQPSPSFAYPDYEYIRDHNRSFSGVIAASGGNSAVAFVVPSEGSAAKPEVVPVGLVSGNYFDVLGVVPALGRVFTPGDNRVEGGHPLAVLGYDFWQRRFAGDPGVIGRAISLNGSPFQIVGVARRGFAGTTVGNPTDIFVPIMMFAQIDRGVPAGIWNSRRFWWLNVIARLKPGVSMRAATPEANLLWQQILANDPERKPAPSYDKDRDKRDRTFLLPGSGGYSRLRVDISKPLTVLMIVVGMVLLIACANVANLLLARSAARQKEIAIRLAIGAGRWRLISQLVLEAVLVSVLGGMAGLLFAWWGTHVMLGFMPRRAIPIDLHLAPDFRILGFAFAVSLVTGILCGLIPALLATRPDLTSSLKNETPVLGRTRFDLRRALVVAQVALSLLLLIGAGLFIRSLRNLQSLDPGFVRESVLLVRVNPENSGYKGQHLRDYYERLLARVSTYPEVRAASLANITPLGGMRWNSSVSIQGYEWKPDEKPYLDMNAVSPHYFETLGIPMLLGRDFRDEDNPPFTPDVDPSSVKLNRQKLGPPPPVAIVNETMAKHFFPNESPIGHRFTTDEKFDMSQSYEIVGVVKDVKYFGVREAPEGMIYIPNWRHGSGGRTLCIRTTGDPQQIISAVRQDAAALDPSVPILQTLTLEQQFDDTISQERIVTSLCGFFGALALLLAAIGLYGVMAHSVARRVREIGIRMALGARPGEVLWLILRDVAMMIGLGALIGLPAAFALTRLVSSFLYGLTPQDPLSIIASTLVLIAITALAGYIPARRATVIDPMAALRHE